MADAAQNAKTDALKRRSTRIVQAVPLTVTGVDALGRPFEERTSTSIINCHGGRYQSKHYVLKNMWVTLEVPHPEQGRLPRNVRARVMWIQRPRTVRELFQVGIELEVPGNLWGIAFGPPDWFPFPDSESEIPARLAEPLHDQTIPEAAEVWLGAHDQLPAEDNLRTMPMAAAVDAGIEPSLALARQMARLVNEAKQELRVAIRDHSAEVVSAEAQPLLDSLRNQMQEAAQRSVEVVAAAAAEQSIRNAVEKAAAMAEARLSTLIDRYNDELGRSLEQYHQKLETRPAEIEPQQRAAFEQQLQSQVEPGLSDLETAAVDSHATLERAQQNLEALRRQAEDSISAAVQDGALRLQVQADNASTRVSEIESALRQSIEQIAPLSASAEAGWRARLEADTAVAAKRWDDRLESSIETAAQKVAERLSTSAQEAGEHFEKSFSERLTGISRTFTEVANDAENRFGAARVSFENLAAQVQALLTQVQSAAQMVTERTAQLDALHETAQQELERRAAALIDIQSQELARRGESAIATWTERLQPSLESAGQETVARLGLQLEQHLGSHIDRANQVLARLESESIAAGEAHHKHQEALAEVSNRIVETAIAQLQKQIEDLGRGFQETGRHAVAHWLAEMDSKATETTHTTFESLFKTAEWYEKKVQTQMQSTLEKGLEQGADQLRDKAGEISRLFAGELDHYSRSYVEHTRGQIEEAGSDTLERARRESAEVTAASVSALAQRMQTGTEAAMRDFHAAAGAALGNLNAQMEEQVTQARAKAEALAQRLSMDFSASMTQQAQQAMGSAKLALTSQADSALESLRAESNASEKHLREALASATDQEIEAYKQRLENTANSWLLTTVSKLHQDSQQQLGALTLAAEERLRDACKQVFASVGEALRQQMLDLPVSPLAPPAKDSSDEGS